MRLDNYEEKPKGMMAYLRNYGWHFSKKMCEWAVSKMLDKNGAKTASFTKERVETILKANNISIKNDYGYDKVYVMNMAYSDFMGSSITTETQLARYVKDYIDDRDGYDGLPFTRFYADCVASGTPIEWEDMLE